MWEKDHCHWRFNLLPNFSCNNIWKLLYWRCNGWFFSYYLFANTGLNSSSTFRILFHSQTSIVWSTIKPWIALQTNNACKSLNFIIKMSALIKEFVALFFHFMVSLIDPLPLDVIQLFFLPKMQELDLHEMWFQQDGASWHTARVTMDLLRGEFGGYFISRSVPVNWALRSCDLTPLVNLLWGYVKVHIYADKPALISCIFLYFMCFVLKNFLIALKKSPLIYNLKIFLNKWSVEFSF